MKKNTLKEFSTKSIDLNNLTLDVESMKVSGYLAAFGVKDDQDDIFVKGCFSKSILEHGPASSSPQKIAYLFNHDFDEIVGKFTLLEEREEGLYFEADLDPTEAGKTLAIRYTTKSINQHSVRIRYMWDKTRYDEQTDAYYIFECKLIEGSAVAMGSNEMTPFAGFKSVEHIKSLDKMCKGLTYEKEIEFKAFFQDLISLIPDEPIKPLETEKAETVKELDVQKIISNLKF